MTQKTLLFIDTGGNLKYNIDWRCLTGCWRKYLYLPVISEQEAEKKGYVMVQIAIYI
jgi:hypothetical protein